MPGIRMDFTGADARDGDSRKRNHEGKLLNGDRTPRKDTPSSNGPGLNGISSSAALAVSAHPLPGLRMDELPPELERIGADCYHPLSKLLDRISVECFSDLQLVLGKMAEMHGPQHPNGVQLNGGYANGLPDNSEMNRQKKLMLMQFAQTNRSKFIKLLVLTQWGKKSSADLAKLIDLFAWTRKRSEVLELTDTTVFAIKNLLGVARLYNPDIKTALPILSLGEADWIPDLGYTPQGPLSPAKALKLLKSLNVSASVRLTVHETLPRHLKNWNVGDGKATFVVDSEFEMDLLTFDQDASEQWHFIDLRLLFSPAPAIDVGGRFWLYFKPQIDSILRDSGLSGCFDFLHNFILTHKIAILRTQAYELARAGWAGTLKVDEVHRMLAVQYWIDRPGKKNWIEIGVSSERPSDGKVSWRGPPVSILTARWHRNGELIPNVKLGMDWKNLSMERILKRVVALHAEHLLQNIRRSLPPNMIVHVNRSKTEPCDCSLDILMGRPENKINVSVEPVTGSYIVQPRNLISSRIEHTLNHPPKTQAWKDVGKNIAMFMAQTLQESIQRHAHQLGWRSPTRHTVRAAAVKKVTKVDVLAYSIYWPSGWATNWVLAPIIDASGESWWFLELDSRGNQIETAQQLKVESTGRRPIINRTVLSSIERLAIQQLSFFATKRECGRQNIPSIISIDVTPSSLDQQQSSPSRNCVRGWILQLRTTDLLTPKPGEDAWLESTIRVTCQSIKGDRRNVSHIASGTIVKDAAADLITFLSSSPPEHFTFAENGTFSILLTTPFGEPIHAELSARLRDVDRLRSSAAALDQRNMTLKVSSLQKVSFQYGKNSFATVNFSNEKDIQVNFNPGNPHNRIRFMLIELINNRLPFQLPGSEEPGLDRLCVFLAATRPLLATLTEIEKSTMQNIGNPRIHVHEIGVYRLIYSNPLCSFDIKLRQKNDTVCWQIEDNGRKLPDARPYPERMPTRTRLESVKTALAKLFREQGPGWIGLGSGIKADIDAIPDALKKLHATVMECVVAKDALPYVETAEPPAQTKQIGSGGGGGAPPVQPVQQQQQHGPPPVRGGQNHPQSHPQNHLAQMNGNRQGHIKKEVIELD